MTALREALAHWRQYWHTPYSDDLLLTGAQADELCTLLNIPFDGSAPAPTPPADLMTAEDATVIQQRAAGANRIDYTPGLWDRILATYAALQRETARYDQLLADKDALYARWKAAYAALASVTAERDALRAEYSASRAAEKSLRAENERLHGKSRRWEAAPPKVSGNESYVAGHRDGWRAAVTAQVDVVTPLPCGHTWAKEQDSLTRSCIYCGAMEFLESAPLPSAGTADAIIRERVQEMSLNDLAVLVYSYYSVDASNEADVRESVCRYLGCALTPPAASPHPNPTGGGE